MKIKVKCHFCNTLLILPKWRFKNTKIHYCNRVCKGKYQTQYRSGKNNPLYKRIIKKCICCGSVLYRKKYTNNRKYYLCNKKCNGEYQSKLWVGKNNPNYIDGTSCFPYPPEFNNNLKDFIRKRDGYKCMECGTPQKELIFTLEPHHIDYDKHNNTTINLISLCKSCNLRANKNRKYWQDHYEQIQIERKVHLLDMKLEMEG